MCFSVIVFSRLLGVLPNGKTSIHRRKLLLAWNAKSFDERQFVAACDSQVPSPGYYSPLDEILKLCE